MDDHPLQKIIREKQQARDAAARKKQIDAEARQAAEQAACAAWPKLKDKFISEIAEANALINKVHDVAFAWTENPQPSGELAVGNIRVQSPSRGLLLDIAFTMHKSGLFMTASGATASGKFGPQIKRQAADITQDDIKSFLASAYDVST